MPCRIADVPLGRTGPVKFFPGQLALLANREARFNLKALSKYFLFVGLLVFVHSALFLAIKRFVEGEVYGWIDALYWTIVTMSTLGYGDIHFTSDLGRAFSTLVLLSGVIFLLVVLPFTFIQFFYAPWLEAQSRLRAPRNVPEGTSGHVIFTQYDPVTVTLIERLRAHARSYYVLEPELGPALDLHDSGVSVILGPRDDVDTYRRVRAEQTRQYRGSQERLEALTNFPDGDRNARERERRAYEMRQAEYYPRGIGET
jgi:voltage-gated potassium channel